MTKIHYKYVWKRMDQEKEILKCRNYKFQECKHGDLIYVLRFRDAFFFVEL